MASISKTFQMRDQGMSIPSQPFVFRGRRGDLLKIIWWDQQGGCLFSKRLEKGRFVWPSAKDGKISVTPAQLSMLLEGIDWRMPQKTWRPLSIG
ncbi:IS66 family insertion sequence element accessory protein TnpB [uncultured Ruegeria sp.]|uniref:IS66 family insertion sequence element accessory protein TnpB n=1 Tax=uncultured Ruegeria sp. TaxID=259304 RepID=UPI0026312A3C|nr:IS66 family insertion sequence element accessory protein TnpB [uncultured Ruegeria sp.]